MPRTKKGTPPSYRQHSSGQAVVTVREAGTNRRLDLLLGPHDSPESHQRYAEVLRQLAANGGRYPQPQTAPPPGAITVAEVVLRWLDDPEGGKARDARELAQYRYALRPLRELYGAQRAEEFGPLCLKALRWRLIADGLCRNVVNARVRRIRTVLNWAVGAELIPAGVAYALRVVRGLRPGQEGVRESEPRRPAFWEDVEKVLPFCARPVGAMLRLQALTGMRSGEVRVMRTLDIDRTDPSCWLYRPGSDAGPHGAHKNAWRGQDRVVPLGPRCIDILKPWLREDDPAAYLFSPRQAKEEYHAARRAARKTPWTPSQLARKRKKDPRRAPGACYTDESYPRAVARACKKAGVSFHPYALRHGRKMEVERAEGSEAARCLLGQKSIQATQHYGTLDLGRARDTMKRLG
jgi:integrase